jgi:hypothetical protein
MFQPYRDILERLGDPLWYDWQGVPRYCLYRPRMQDVYADYDALLEVRCQGCGRTFRVGTCAPRVLVFSEGGSSLAMLPSESSIGSFGYGDAPWHADAAGHMCSGVTMGAVPIRVVEFWVNEGFNWERCPAFEVAFSPKASEAVCPPKE